MGPSAFEVVASECGANCSQQLRVHAMTTLASNDTPLALICNFGTTAAFNVTLDFAQGPTAEYDMYQLTGRPGANHIFFNGDPLTYTSAQAGITMNPKTILSSQLVVPPSSVTVVLPKS